MAIINAGPAERRNDLNLYLTASFFALLHMVILSAKCHANQCETFRRATTRVQIIDRPVKFSVEPDGSRWLEVHEPLSRNRAEFESDKKVPLPVTPVLRTFIKGDDVDTSRVNEVLERRSGMPVNISAGRSGL